MSLDIKWETILKNWSNPQSSCEFLTKNINNSLSGANSPISNLRVTQFDLTACEGPSIELLDFTDIRDEFLFAVGRIRDIRSPPPSDSSSTTDNRNVIDSASFLYDRPVESLKAAIVQDGLEASFQVCFKGTAIRIEFEADAVLNVPVPNFLALPLKFALTRLDLEGKVLVALSAELDRIFLSLPEPLTEFDFQLSVDVGDAEKHVLRNVAKIEKFCREQVQELLNDRLLLPRFIEIPLHDK